MTTIPSIWPTPDNPQTRVRVFRVEIERPDTGSPVLTAHMQEAAEVGGTTFRTCRPDLALSASLPGLLADADPLVSNAAANVAQGLEAITWALYQRKITGLSAATPK